MTLTPPRVARRTQASRRADASRSLLDAAAELFSQRGIEQTSLAEIGELAGYSRGLASHHFGSKAALVEQLIAHCQTTFVEVLDRPVGSTSLDAIQAIAETYLRHYEHPLPGSRAFLVMWGASFPAENHVASIAKADRWVRSQVEGYIQAGHTDGSISTTVDPASFAVIFVGLIRGVSGLLISNPSDVDVAALHAQLRAVIDASLKPKVT